MQVYALARTEPTVHGGPTRFNSKLIIPQKTVYETGSDSHK